MSELEPRGRPLPGYEPDDERETLFAVLSGVQRRGAWEPACHVRVFALMGGAELDFSDAVLVEGVTEVTIFVSMGGVDITVPQDVNVEVRGFGILGGFKQLDHRALDPDAPTLRINGFALMGGVGVKLKKERRWFKRS